MKARSRFAIITTALAALSLSALASAEMKSAGGGGLEFKLPGGTAGLTIEGKSEQLTASEAGGKIVVVAKLDCGETSCLKTGIDKRDEHLWKHMESGKYKTATLTVDKSSLKLPADNDKSEGDASGGTQRVVNLPVTRRRRRLVVNRRWGWVVLRWRRRRRVVLRRRWRRSVRRRCRQRRRRSSPARRSRSR